RRLAGRFRPSGAGSGGAGAAGEILRASGSNMVLRTGLKRHVLEDLSDREDRRRRGGGRPRAFRRGPSGAVRSGRVDLSDRAAPGHCGRGRASSSAVSGRLIAETPSTSRIATSPSIVAVTAGIAPPR